MGTMQFMAPPASLRYRSVHSLAVGLFALHNRRRPHSVACLSRFSSIRQDPEVYKFGENLIDKRQVFLTTKLSFALVNIRPVVPGHVLVTPKRLVKRFMDLTADETADLWITARDIGSKIESHFGASSLTFALQDGPEAGQTVPHVHVHILPRKGGDFKNNDDIYYAIEDKRNDLNLDILKENRTIEEMAEEADDLRKLFR